MNNVIYEKDKGMGVSWKNWASQINDEGVSEQMLNVTRHPGAFHHVATMPDAHSGYGLPIGGVAAFEDMVLPYAVGSDIACSMMAVRTDMVLEDLSENSLQDIMKEILKVIPVGTNRNPLDWYNEVVYHRYLLPLFRRGWIPESITRTGITGDDVISSMRSLGSNNHFWEAQVDCENHVWVMIHSGSRMIGYKTCGYYHRLAKELNDKWCSDIPSDKLAFFPTDSEEGKNYIEAMEFCMTFSRLNKEAMMDAGIKCMEKVVKPVKRLESYHVFHNFARLENHFGKNVWVHRKGATPAFKDKYGVIPGSRGAASYIVKGKGNPDSFCSCSHGAGRTMSRKKSKEVFSTEQIKEEMSGIVYNKLKADESKGAYKNISEVMRDQQDLVDIVWELKPIMNIKG